jgi:hypothetical protein
MHKRMVVEDEVMVVEVEVVVVGVSKKFAS